MFKKTLAIIITVCLAGLSAGGCGNSVGSTPDEAASKASAETTAAPTAAKAETNLPKPDMTKWQYNEEDKAYYQLGIDYCEKPVDKNFEQLAIVVPAAYMDATDNGDGTFTCKLNESATVNGYTASTAPIAIPIDTPFYAPAHTVTEYQAMWEGVTEFIENGMVYVYPGCRGMDHGAPAGVTDLKAAIRYLRYCDDVTAGDAERIFVHGTSGGGAQAAILGASGDSSLYDPYLKAIGAVQGVSDAVAGVMSWCPITDLYTANAEYEWMMGCTRTGRTAEQQAISDGLANAFPVYLNSAGFTDKDGKALTLEKSEEGIYQAGSYYDYVKSEIERSLNNYLSDTNFKTVSVDEYINRLNKDTKWVNYDKATNTATITSIADFAKCCKQASEFVVAFDPPTTSITLFGFGDGKGVHFDKILGDVLAEQHSEYAYAYANDLKRTDSYGNTVEQRLNMYTPLYYLMPTREGYGTATVAKYWRIRSGIKQTQTSVTTEINLALALEHCDGVESVDFETVWEQEHGMAERSGYYKVNYIEWINQITK